MEVDMSTKARMTIEVADASMITMVPVSKITARAFFTKSQITVVEA